MSIPPEDYFPPRITPSNYDHHWLDMRKRNDQPEKPDHSFRNGFLCAICSVLVVTVIASLAILAFHHS